ncbi:MAG: glycosyltransferase family 4 protein [Bacteroidales bacterium]|jgi:hypothetical protein
MNILFLTISRFNDVEDKGIYTDLMRKFRDEEHKVYVVTPLERRYKQKTSLRENKGIYILGVQTLNIQKTNVIEKGIGTLLVEYQFLNAINKYINNIKFDLVLYSTPPITFTKAIKSIKKRDNSFSYLLLKDIFPQNAVDINLMKKDGLLHKIFLKKEKKLYQVSDFIGCMSPANVKFVLDNNPFINPNQIEVNPNSIDLLDYKGIDRNAIRRKYSIPENVLTFIYGGNLGKPQGIDFLLECLKANANRDDAYFIIAGSGTEYAKINNWIQTLKPRNIKLFEFLPRNEYDDLAKACDIGLIFLDDRFTIPNYPSRLLAYLSNKMPIFAATDINTDIGKIAEKNGYGYWCESKNVEKFNELVDKYIYNSDIKSMGEKGYNYLLENYTIDVSYNNIVKHFNK